VSCSESGVRVHQVVRTMKVLQTQVASYDGELSTLNGKLKIK
jgi:hypothetical protein